MKSLGTRDLRKALGQLESTKADAGGQNKSSTPDMHITPLPLRSFRLRLERHAGVFGIAARFYKQHDTRI